jgi:hypothetical protein
MTAGMNEELVQQLDELRKLQGPELIRYVMNNPWYVSEDDTIGGWCITLLPLSASSGVPVVANFIDLATACHATKLHNQKLNERRVRRSWGQGPQPPPPDFGHVEDYDNPSGGWLRCHQDCQLELVRPGKVQCICDTEWE